MVRHTNVHPESTCLLGFYTNFFLELAAYEPLRFGFFCDATL
jgi:hypothetical protein